MSAETLAAVESNWLPSRVESREAIRKAVMLAAYMNDGLVHIADVRPFLPDSVAPEQIGAQIAGLQARGFLEPTGEYRPNGDSKAGNQSKPAMVRRLVRPIPPESA